MIKKIIHIIKKEFHQLDCIMRKNSTGLLEWECRELEHIFALLLFGFIVGVPSAPMHISLEMLTVMEGVDGLLTNKIDTAHDPLAELFSLLDIG